MTGRRDFLAGASVLLAAPRLRAQQPGRHYRVGVLCPFRVDNGKAYLAVLRETLAANGFVDGRNLTIEARAAYWDRLRGEQEARELIARKVDVIFSLTTILTWGAQSATRDVPIVFAWVGDPAVSGIVRNYARPDGNTTGVTNRFFQLWDKRLELLRDLLPEAKRVAVLAGIFDDALKTALRLTEPVVKRLGFELVLKESRGDWIGAMKTMPAEAVFVATPFAQFGLRDAAQQVVRQASELRLPTVYSDPESVELGGLMSFVTNPTEGVRRGAEYVARVLKGIEPGELPVDQASRFELLVNLEAARAIGLAIPQSILLRADRVIE
jgi:ABC-type uncharacterized transport system substrate-binding protein